MIVGVPTEIKNEEYRVACTPVGVRELTARGHVVLVQSGAGAGSSITDADYIAAGAEMAADATEVFARAELVLKVKEPQASEIAMLRPEATLFTYLHLAAYPAEAKGLVESGATCIAYETVEMADGSLPLLAPMSEIAGRMAAQAGSYHLEKPRGGRGVLMGGVPGVAPAAVTVIGGGSAGANAAVVASGMGADVTILDINVARLRHIDELHHGRIKTIRSSIASIDELVAQSDLVIGAVLVAGARAPIVVSEDNIKSMKPGSVVVDISIDQGGCMETSHETSHADPTYIVHSVVHYAVGNIPGAVPHTATYALTNVTMPYAVALAEGFSSAAARFPELVPGVNVAAGKVTNQAVAAALETDYTDPAEVLNLPQ